MLSSFSASNNSQCISLRQFWMHITLLMFAWFLWYFTCGCMIEWRIRIHKIIYPLLAHVEPFITELFEGPSYIGRLSQWDMEMNTEIPERFVALAHFICQFARYDAPRCMIWPIKFKITSSTLLSWVNKNEIGESRCNGGRSKTLKKKCTRNKLLIYFVQSIIQIWVLRIKYFIHVHVIMVLV